jgi:acyl-coenzyme A synthetase/AMP-(fatty) acid ligase
MELSVFDEGPPPPCPAPFNMAAHTLAAAEARASHVALEVLSGPGEVAERWTYGALRDAVLRTAGGLAAAGIGRGDRVLLRLGHTSRFPLVFFAANALGAVPVPTSSMLGAAEVARIAADLEPKALVTDREEGLRAAVTIAAAEIDALRRHEPAAFAATAPDDPAFIVYTSGTGGRPKGVVHAQRAAWARRMMWRGWYGLEPGDRVLHAGAFNWTYTLGAGLTDPWAAGATALIHAGPADRHVWPRLAAAHAPTIFAAVPGVYRQMLGAPGLGDGFAALRHGLSAGEALPLRVRTEWEAATGRPIYEALGMSEISTYISFSPDHPGMPGRAGRPQPGRRVAILDEAGGPVPRGEPGDLAVSRRDPGLMLGYWRRAAETAAAFKGEWFVTGDRAIMHEDGTITHLGRSDDLMNAGGFRVDPVEVEAALLEHPLVVEAAAVERAVKADARVIVAFYVAQPGGEIDEAGLAAHCAARLARYKQPRIFRRVAALPHGPTGKLLRRQLRDLPLD